MNLGALQRLKGWRGEEKGPRTRPCEQPYLNLRTTGWGSAHLPSLATRLAREGRTPNPSNRCWFKNSFAHHQPRRGPLFIHSAALLLEGVRTSSNRTINPSTRCRIRSVRFPGSVSCSLKSSSAMLSAVNTASLDVSTCGETSASSRIRRSTNRASSSTCSLASVARSSNLRPNISTVVWLLTASALSLEASIH
jgi:hypothetical protein